MANPAIKNGYFPIANELAEHFAKVNITGQQWRILWVLLRKTWGFSNGDRRKDWDWISITQFENLTEMKRANTYKTLKTLLAKRLILQEKNRYSFNQNYNQWLLVKRLTVLAKRLTPISQKTNKTVSQLTTYKRNKENNTKETYIPIYKNYQEKINQKSKLTEQAKIKIKTRLKVYSIEELKKAMVKFSQEDWWMKNNSHRGVAWFFHSDDRIDQFLNFKEITLEQIAVKMVKECEDKFGFDKGANIASFRFQRKYGDEELLKYQKIFKGEV